MDSSKDMQALSWLFMTMYTCSVTDEAGCTAMLTAVEVPFASEDDVGKAVDKAAAEVKKCAAGAGRRLKAWGATVIDDNPGVQVNTFEAICSTAGKLAESGETLPELDEFGGLDGLAAVGTGLARATIATYVGMRFPGQWYAAAGTNLGVGMLFGKMFYEKIADNCYKNYGEQSCGEIAQQNQFRQAAHVLATGPTPDGTVPSMPANSAVSKAVLDWGATDACKTCAKDLTAVCLKHVALYNKKFRMAETMANSAGMVAGGFVRLMQASDTATTTADSDKLVRSTAFTGIISPLWQAFRFAQAARGQPQWVTEEGLPGLAKAVDAALEARERHLGLLPPKRELIAVL